MNFDKIKNLIEEGILEGLKECQYGAQIQQNEFGGTTINGIFHLDFVADIVLEELKTEFNKHDEEIKRLRAGIADIDQQSGFFCQDGVADFLRQGALQRIERVCVELLEDTTEDLD